MTDAGAELAGAGTGAADFATTKGRILFTFYQTTDSTFFVASLGFAETDTGSTTEGWSGVTLEVTVFTKGTIFVLRVNDFTLVTGASADGTVATIGCLLGVLEAFPLEESTTGL